MSFHFGAAVVLLCLLQYGMLSGLIASFVSSLSLYFLLDNPFFFLVLGLETLVIGLLLSRGVFMLMACIIYWVLVGMPVTFAILYMANPEFAFNGLLLIMKQGINGILYASIASIIAPFLPESWFKKTWNQQLPAMSVKIFEHFSTITAITGLVTGLVLAELSIRDNESQLQKNLANKASQASAFIYNYIESHQAKIENKADSLSMYNLSNIDPVSALDYTQKNYPGFLTMLIANKEGVIIAGAPESFYQVLKTVPEDQRSVSDRDYYLEAKASGESFVSQAFVGRGFGNDIIVAISAPVYANGEFDGIVEGSLNLSRFSQIEKDLAPESGAIFVLVDKNDNILYSSDSLKRNAFDKFNYKISQDSYANNDNILQIRGNELAGSYFFESKQTVNDWRVIILRKTSLINNIVETYYQYLMGIFAGVFLLTFVISKFLSKNLTRPLERIVSDLSLDRITENEVDQAVFTKETHSLKQRLQQTKQVYLDFQDELKSQVEKRTSELSEANAKLKKLSREDSLTQLLNRRGFDEEFQKDLKKSIRFQTPMCLAMIDIDHFKKINDTYGHPVGDQFLRFLGQSLGQQMQRNTDIVARVGGEEFAILFHADSPTACQSKLESCRAAAMSIKVEAEEKKLGISISAGAVFLIPSPNTQLEQLYSQADKLLYQSKTEGRNRLTFEIME